MTSLMFLPFSKQDKEVSSGLCLYSHSLTAYLHFAISREFTSRKKSSPLIKT